MECENNLEAKEKLLKYLQLPDKIKYLKLKKHYVSIEFYASRSMTGTMPIGDMVEQNNNRAIAPEYGALLIVERERIIQSRIEKAEKQHKLFSQLMPHLNVSKLLTYQPLYYVTEAEQQALNAIDEVEYYLKEHDKAKRQQKPKQAGGTQELKQERDDLMKKLAMWGI